VNGLAFAVAREALELFDVRERQYVRRVVTDLIDADPGGPVFAYFGRAEARERYERAVADGRAVVSREYHDEVRAGFALLGDDQLALYDATTDPPAVPLSDLRRIAVPPAGAPSASAPPHGPSRSPGAA
jgi:hypothetical protein